MVGMLVVVVMHIRRCLSSLSTALTDGDWSGSDGGGLVIQVMMISSASGHHSS